MSDVASKTIPKVFISYSWSDNKERILQIAEDLLRDGIDVVIDQWDLKAGHDKYDFMEQMVKEPSINFVLIMCDKSYTTKADARGGGVGDETVIISPELYGQMKQEKFIPIVLEKNEKGEPYLPVYLKTRIYFDFTNTCSEDEYPNLVRTLYGEPFREKPELGEKPAWLSNKAVNTSMLQSAVSRIRNTNDTLMRNKIFKQFSSIFIETAKKYVIDASAENINVLGENIKIKIYEMQPLRDSYLDALNECILDNTEITDFIIGFFEKIYNELLFIGTDDINETKISYHKSSVEHYKFMIWNCFVCSILYLLHYEKYTEIRTLLTHTYFLQEERYPERKLWPSSFISFKTYLDVLDGEYGKNQNILSYMADIAMNFTKHPLVTPKNFCQTDIILCQLSFVLKHPRSFGNWFPNTYVYAKETESIWIKLTSQKNCKKILPLFGTTNIEAMKALIKENHVPDSYKYDGTLTSVPSIPLKIHGYEIGSLP